MAKAFSVASWNVEHFGITRRIGGQRETRDQINERIQRVANYLKEVNADISAIYEVSGSQVFNKFREIFPNHHFFITEGLQTQEILVMVKKTINVFITQKTEFKAGNAYLRPGALATVTVDGVNYPVLFLHLKSLPNPKGFGLRDDMINRAVAFRGKLWKAARKQMKINQGLSTLPPATDVPDPNFLFLGDLNIMGLNYRGRENDITATDEMKNLDLLCKRNSVQMRRLSKNETLTYRKDEKLESDLDHVVASKHLQFKQFNGSDVKVLGWPEQETDAQRDQWRIDYSDHALLYFEVQKIE